MPKPSPRTPEKLLVALLALLVSVVAAQTAAAGDQGPTVVDGNPKCTGLGYEAGFKPNFGATGETPPVGGPVTLSDGTLEVTVEVTGLNGSDEPVVIDWSSNIGVDAVIMKGSDGANVYVYEPPTEVASGSGLTTPTNNGGNRPKISHIEFCYDTTGGKLKIEKTAETRSIIVYLWKIEKTVDREQIMLTKEPTGKATYTVSATRDDGTEQGWQVWGDITVTNGTDATAELTSVTDELDGTPIDVQCDAPGFPLELGPGQTLTCSYGPIDLPNGNEIENVAKVATAVNGKVEGSSTTVPVTFGEPVPVDDKVTVIDDFATPGFIDDDIWWEFAGTGSEKYEYTYHCKDAGTHTNTAAISDQAQPIDDQIDVNDQLANAVVVDQRAAQATVTVVCDTKTDPAAKPEQKDASGRAAPQAADSPQPPAPIAQIAPFDLSCLGADAVRGSFGDSAWGLIGSKGPKTKFFLSKRTYWKVLNLKKPRVNNEYFKLGAAYIMARLHRLTGSWTSPALERSMSWALRYFMTHRPGYSKLGPKALPERRRIVRRVQRLMRKHKLVLNRHVKAIDAARCTI